MLARSFSRRLISGPCRIMICAALVWLVTAGNAFAHGVTFKLQHVEPADPVIAKQFLEPWSQKIHDESGGRINLLITPRDQSITETQLFQIALDRTADIVWLDVKGPSASFPRFNIFGLALEGASSEGSSQALWSWIDINDLGFREFREMRILAASRHDAPVFHMREKALSSLSDLKGLKIAIPDSSAEVFLTALGASPVILSKPAMRDALAQATVDGVLLAWSSLAALKLEELVKTHSAAPAGAPWPYAELSVLLMNPDAYRSLADDLKQVIRGNSGSDVSARIGKTFDENAIRARKVAAGRGNNIGNLPDSDLKPWREAANAAVNTRVKELDASGLKGERMISRARGLIKDYDTAR